MNINENEIVNFIQAYHKRNFDDLAQNVNPIDKRLQFEGWLSQHFSPHAASSADFAWHSRVIALMCTKTREDATASLENKKKEDGCLANLIIKADPSQTPPPPQKSPSFTDRSSHLIRHIASVTARFIPLLKGFGDNPSTDDPSTRILDISQIQAALQGAHLPVTQVALLRERARISNFNLTREFRQTLREDNFSMVKALANAFPGVFHTIMMNEIKKDRSLLHSAYSPENEKKIACLAQAHPLSFITAMKKRNGSGLTPLSLAVSLSDKKMIKCLAKAHPKAFKAAMIKRDKSDLNPLGLAVKTDNIEMIKYLAKIDLDAFKAAMMTLEEIEFSPVRIAAILHKMEILTFMAQTAPDTFKAALTLQDEEGMTPLYTVLAQIHSNVEIINFLIKEQPDALNILDHKGRSVLSNLKALRPAHYPKILPILNSHLTLRQHHKGIFPRIALSHAWHLSGDTSLVKADTKATLTTLDLAGHISPEWFHLMAKDLRTFQEVYPQLLKPSQLSLLKHLFDLGANGNFYSLEDKIKRMKSGLPVILKTGSTKHAVTVLIWDDQFIICNRGEASRKPIEIYHFNSSHLDEGILKQIEEDKWILSPEAYQELFFSTLPQKLAFSQNELDRQMEAAFALPNQTVGNCSFLSPVTAIYAFLLLSTLRGMDEQGCLLNEGMTSAEVFKERADKALASYQTWLSHVQLSFLEKSIAPLAKGNHGFLPDHSLIVNALHKAHLLPLDPLGEKRLDDLTALYTASLDPEAAAQLKSDVAKWKSLSRKPLL